tara:strand:- start:32 stop:568 length:537 start_codon:yes stop_codon:yes gene_type:complete
MDNNGKLNKESLKRLDYTAKQFFKKRSNNIISTGWDYRNDSEIIIAEVFKKKFLNQGIPKTNIFTTNDSRDTVGDAFFSKINIVMKKKWYKLLVVTSLYHTERTKLIFDYIYGSKYSITVEASDKIISDNLIKKEEKSTRIFKSTFKNVKRGNDSQIYKTLRKLHPFYNGDIYTQINL